MLIDSFIILVSDFVRTGKGYGENTISPSFTRSKHCQSLQKQEHAGSQTASSALSENSHVDK